MLGLSVGAVSRDFAVRGICGDRAILFGDGVVLGQIGPVKS